MNTKLDKQQQDSTHAGIIDLRNVSLTYATAQKETLALDQVSLSVAPSEPIAIIGPSGCGKTSLLNIITGLITASSGEVFIDGQTLQRPRQKTALILQDYGLLPWKTVIDNAALGLTLRQTPRKLARQRAMEALQTVGLADFAQAFPKELSGGMSQRLALARAMALDCDIMLMDEPLSALDALKREELQNLLLDMQQQQGYAQVLVTHSIEEAVFLGRRIVLMTPRPGRIRRVIDNPLMGSADYRGTAQFYEMCTMLRKLLLTETAETGEDVQFSKSSERTNPNDTAKSSGEQL